MHHHHRHHRHQNDHHRYHHHQNHPHQDHYHHCHNFIYQGGLDAGLDLSRYKAVGEDLDHQTDGVIIIMIIMIIMMQR